MHIFNQIYYTAKRLLLDFKPIAIMIISYMVIILILGSAFQSEFESSDLDKVTVLYLNQDEGESGASFLDELMHMDGIKELVEFKKADSFDSAEKKIKKEKAEALIYLPEKFSKQAASQDESNIVKMYRSKYSGINALVVQSVVETYINGLNTAGVVYKMTGSLDNFQFDLDSAMKKEPLTTKGKIPGSMGYYAIAMVIMMMLYGADYGNQGIGEDYHGTIGDRMRLSQIKPYQQYVGKVIGASLVTFFEAIVIVAFTTIGYHVNWGNNIGLLFLILFSFAILTTTFGGMLSVLTGSCQKASVILSTCVFVFTFLAGGFVAMDFGVAKYFTLNYYPQSAVTNLIYQGSQSLVWRNIGVMWITTAVFVIVSVAAGGRKRA